MWQVTPMLWLVIESVISNIGHVLQPCPPHSLLPGECCCSGVQQKIHNKIPWVAIDGGSETVLLNLLENSIGCGGWIQ